MLLPHSARELDRASKGPRMVQLTPRVGQETERYAPVRQRYKCSDVETKAPTPTRRLRCSCPMLYVQLQRCRPTIFKSLPQHDRIHLAGRLLRHAGTRGQPGPESCEVTLEANPCTSETDTSRLFRIDSCRGNRFLQVFASFSNAIRS
jgi:hypothetical protein